MTTTLNLTAKRYTVMEWQEWLKIILAGFISFLVLQVVALLKEARESHRASRKQQAADMAKMNDSLTILINQGKRQAEFNETMTKDFKSLKSEVHDVKNDLHGVKSRVDKLENGHK